MTNMFSMDTTLDEMYLSQALRNRTITFIEEFTRESCYKAIYLMERIRKLDDEEKLPKEKRIITLEWSSYGGCAYSCLALISAIEKFKEMGYTINSHVMSFAMSAGFFTSIVCSHRTMARYGYLMNHQMSSGVVGEVQTMKESLEHDEELWDKLKQITIKNTKLTDTMMEDMRNRKLDWYLDAEEALKHGCIDEII